MSTKDIAVVDTDTALAPSPADRGRRSPAPASGRADLNVTGGSNVGSTATDDAFALEYEEGEGRELVERDDNVDPTYPKVAGHQWVERDKPIIESFVEKADEIGLTATQRNELASWFVGDALVAAGAAESVEDFTFDAEADIKDNALGKAVASSFKEFALAAGMAPTMANQTVDFFLDQCRVRITAQDAKHREESIADVGLDWGADHAENVRTTQQYLTSLGSVGKIIKNARTADGRRLIFAPGIPQFLHEAAMREKDPNPESKVSSGFVDATKLRREADALRTLLRDNREEYYNREWRGSGVTGSDRALEIERELGAKVRGEPTTSSAARARDLADERRELVKLEKTDPESFEHGRWRDSKITPAERLHQIVSKGR